MWGSRGKPLTGAWNDLGAHSTTRPPRVNRARAARRKTTHSAAIVYFVVSASTLTTNCRLRRGKTPALAGGVRNYPSLEERDGGSWKIRHAGIRASSSDGSRSTYPRPHTV